MTNTSSLMWLAASATALALGIATAGTASAQAPANKFGTVRIATFGPAITSLPTHVMQQKGFDTAAGFSTEVSRATGSVGIKAMLAGDFDFTLSAGSALAAAVSGAPVKVIYAHVQKSLYFLYAREGIDAVKDLEGKKIGIDAIGATQDFTVRRAMRDAGADDRKTIFLAMGFQNTPPSMIAGAIDAGVITPPREYQLINSPKKFVNLGFLGDLAPSLTGGIGTTEKLLAERRPLAEAMVAAHQKAHRFVLENRDETIAIMSKFLNLSMEDAAHSYDTTVRPHYHATGIASAETQKSFIEEQARTSKLATPPEPAKVFDFSLIK